MVAVSSVTLHFIATDCITTCFDAVGTIFCTKSLQRYLDDKLRSKSLFGQIIQRTNSEASLTLAKS